jgi:hypothetical protein
MRPFIRLTTIVLATLLIGNVLYAQFDVIKVPVNGKMVSCGPHGSVKNPQQVEYTMNPKKNRYDTPSQSDFNTEITLKKLISPTATQGKFTEGQAIDLVGYVDLVMVGGTESCNCKTVNPKYRDTHIELVPTPGDTASQDILIVEVTPRMREIEQAQAVDWATATLKKTLSGHKVRIKGWLMFDWDHIDENWADDPDDSKGKPNWRASCWEVHPITSIEILD